MLWLNYSERNNHIEKFPVAVKHTDHRFVRRNFSRVTFHSLKFTRCKITHYSLQNLLVTRCRSYSLQKITRYSLQNSLVARCRSCSLQKKALVTRCEICLLLVVTNHSLIITCFLEPKNSKLFQVNILRL